jgi:hypothetical protein
LYGIFWWRWAKVSYNNFKQYPPVWVWVSSDLPKHKCAFVSAVLLAPK